MYLSPKERISGLPAIIYRRKSQEDKSRQILSLSTQADICDELTIHWNLRIIDNYSESKSAKIPDQRQKFTELMHRIEDGEVEVIICWKIDRLVRNMKEGGWIIDALQNGKLKAIVTKEKVYLPEDNTLITSIEMAGATEYSRELSKKVHDSIAKKARKGVPNTRAILGYLNNTHKEQGERDWRDDPERWHHCQKAIRKILNEDMIPYHAFLWLRDEVKMTTPICKTMGGKPLSKSVFYRFLKRPEIAGFFEYKDKKMNINDCITPMVSEEEYWQLQIRLGSNGTTRKRKKLSVYSGHIFSPSGDICTPCLVKRVTCDCKKKFSIKSKTVCPRCNTDIADMSQPIFLERTYYYNSRLKNERKKTKGVSDKVLDEAMIDLGNSILLSPELTQWSQAYLSSLRDREIGDIKKIDESRSQHLEKIMKRKNRAKEAFLDGIFSKEEYQEEIEKIQLDEMREKARPKVIDWYATAQSLTTLGQEIIHIWKNGTVEDKRLLLGRLQVNHLWDEQKHRIIMPKPIKILISELSSLMYEKGLGEPVESVAKQSCYVYSLGAFPYLGRMWEAIRTSILKDRLTVVK